MGSDDEDFVFFGTPIEREEEITTRKKKSVAEASGNMRALPSWKQEVRDEEGRRRFHGAFSGGFSAGYYNTVGSKEGWAPQSFTSSRKNRAGMRQQNISDFLDEDEKAELEGQSLTTNSQFDTFGFTASEQARKQAEKEQHQRPSAIPGPVPDELVVPVSESIGVNLLLKMGWRRGQSIKDLGASSDARREARKAFLAFSGDEKAKEISGSQFSMPQMETSHKPNDDVHRSDTTPVYVLNPKQDLHGLGYDPFKHAPEFRDKKRSRMNASKELVHRKPLSMKESLFGSKSGKIAPGFGIGALEELDIEDEDIYAGVDYEETYVKEEEEPLRPTTHDRLRLTSKELDVLPGFRAALNSDYNVERFNPPKIPKDFVARHNFSGPLETEIKASLLAPPEVPPPEDNNLKLMIDGFATFVSRCGKLFEDLSKEKNQSNPLFDFLRGGKGHEYYVRRLWEEQQKRSDQNKLPLDGGKSSPSMQKMTAETRGRLLGERPLERSSREAGASASSGGSFRFPSNLSDAFTSSASSQEAGKAMKPFEANPAKQERFEQFLKEKYYGGLRTADSNRVNEMSDGARARERLDFEAAAEALEKGKVYKEDKLATERPIDFLGGGLQFTSGGLEGKGVEGEEMKAKKMYPKREEFQWRPAPLLCKRFDLVDPYMGKPPAAPRAKNKMDSLIFLPDRVQGVQDKDPNLQEESNDAKEPEIEVQVESVERPVDLYKAIFSDDSGDEEPSTEVTIKRGEEQGNKDQAAASTLNRLIAGDFLESLGKELGLDVPPEVTRQLEDDKSPKGRESRMDRSKETTMMVQEETPSSYGEKEGEELSRKKREKSGERGRRKSGNISSESSGEERRRKRSKHSDTESDSGRHGSRSRRKRGESSRERKRSRSHKKHSSSKHKRRHSKKSYSSSDEEEDAEDLKRRHRRRD